MKKLVVVADDFGLCSSVNDGIIESCKDGIVTELSLMLGSPGTEDAVSKAQQNGINNIGLHTLLTFWKDNGKTTRREDYKVLFRELDQSEIEELFYAEVKLFERIVGRKPSHVTSQYGIHGHPKLLSAVLKYCSENNTPLRLPHKPSVDFDIYEEPDYSAGVFRKLGIKTTDMRSSMDRGTREEVEEMLISSLDNLADLESIEITLHPGRVSEELRSLSSLVDERERDIDLALSKDLKNVIAKNNIKLVGYSDL